MRRAATIFTALAAALATAAPAMAADRASLSVLTGLKDGPRAYVLKGSTVRVAGTVRPFIAGQKVRVRISSRGRKANFVTAAVRQAKGGTGSFRVVFRARRKVTYSLVAQHRATPEQGYFQARKQVHAVGNSAAEGWHGMGVAMLKKGLRALGYPAGSGTYFTGQTARAVMAFRKTNSMARNFSASPAIFKKVFAGKGAFKLRYPKAGKHVEADLSRQVLVLADQGRVLATYHTSSGSYVTPTIRGHYHFYTKGPGTNAKGMYMSNYFIRGYAIHGYPSVPTYPASHGCLRVPNADANAIYNWIRLGDSIFVYV